MVWLLDIQLSILPSTCFLWSCIIAGLMQDSLSENGLSQQDAGLIKKNSQVVWLKSHTTQCDWGFNEKTGEDVIKCYCSFCILK